MPVYLYTDPGMTTGWASFSELGFKSGQHDFDGICSYLERLTSYHGPNLHIGWEDFIITSKTYIKKESHWSMEVIGVIRWLAHKHGCKLLPTYTSSTLLPKGNEQLKRMGWYAVGMGHANDAAQHLMHYMMYDKKLPSNLLDRLLERDVEPEPV